MEKVAAQGRKNNTGDLQGRKSIKIQDNHLQSCKKIPNIKTGRNRGLQCTKNARAKTSMHSRRLGIQLSTRGAGRNSLRLISPIIQMTSQRKTEIQHDNRKMFFATFALYQAVVVQRRGVG